MPYIFSLSCFIHFIHLSWISFLTIIGKVYHLSLPLSFLTKDKSSWFSFILTALKLIVHNWFVKSDTDKVCFLCFFFFWPRCMAWRIIALWSGIESGPPAVEAGVTPSGPPGKSPWQCLGIQLEVTYHILS